MNSAILDEYRDFIKLFIDETSEETHEILIVEDKISEKISIYSLSSEKLEAL